MTDPINVSMIERSGKYINVEASAPVMLQPRNFGLYVDEATAGNEYPEVYLIFKSDNNGAPDKTFYGSFDLTPVWSQSTCKGITLHFQTYSGVQTVIYSKDITIRPQ